MAMSEATVNNPSGSLRTLFVIISTWCVPSKPLALYLSHRNAIADHILHRQCIYHKEQLLTLMIMFDVVLNDIRDKVIPMGD